MLKRINFIKLISFLLGIVIFLLPQTSVYAAESKFTDTALIKALNSVEPIKEQMGINNINYSDLKIASPIKSYNYTEEGLVESFEYYPLLYNGELKLFAIKDPKASASYYQITNVLVNEIISCLKDNDKIAIIYDNDACFLYDGFKMTELVRHNARFMDRKNFIINKSLDCSFFSNVQRKKLNLESKYITYQSVATNFSLNNYISEYLYEIEVIGQKNDNSICWAATAASASNFLRNTTYDADDVAKLYYGQNNYNRGIDPFAMPSVLLMLGITSYTHMGFIDNYSENALSRIVYNNIVNYKPAFFSVTYSHANVQPYPNYHSVLIYGVDLTNNMIVVMDPWQNGGFYAAYYGESVQLDRVGYKYISPILGTEVVALRMTAFYTTY